MKKIQSWLMLALCPMLFASCSDKENDEPIIPSQDVAENIVGTWLLSTSDADNWVSYEITESSRINAEIAQSGYYGTGTGFYSIKDEKFSGSYTTDRGQTYYVDWIVSAIKPFEISFKIYDENTFVGDAALYRVVSNETIEVYSDYTPDYRGLCGSSSMSDFKILDNSIAEIDMRSGAIYGIKEGVTFLTFNTPNGIAAIKITVSGKIKTFEELLQGTWVYDVPAEKTWERYTFTDNNYLFVEWTTSVGNINLDESSQGLYSIENETVSFTANSSTGQLHMKFVTESINDFNWTYSAYESNHMTGKYTAQRLLESVSLSPEGTSQPNYQALVGTAVIQGYKSHNSTVASVSTTGEILAKAKGRTYIDVVTNKGTGVVEVNVDGGAIPVAFEECLGKGVDKVHELLGDKPYYEDETIIYYKNYTDDIEMIGVDLDAQSGLVKGVVITYKSSVKTSQVTSILDATFIPYMSQTTDTFKAYMDTAEREDASVGVTWDIPSLTLTYVNLATDLFTDYSVLIGMNKSKVLDRMGRQPDSSNEESQSWFFFDNKGIKIVSAYYTDFVTLFDDVRSVVTMFDDTLTVEQITKYLKKKYPYYPEHSNDNELVFIPEGNKMVIYYQPKDKMIMYISTASTKANSRASINKLKLKAKSIKR